MYCGADKPRTKTSRPEARGADLIGVSERCEVDSTLGHFGSHDSVEGDRKKIEWLGCLCGQKMK